jgi:hypothetical protein
VAVRADRAFLTFCAAVFVFHDLPVLAGPLVDLYTPLLVVGAAALVLVSLRADLRTTWLALAAGVVYVDGHGIHLAANDVRNYDTVTGEAARVAHFWDERWGHLEWHAGWFALLAVFCLAELRAPGGRLDVRVLALAAVLLGATLFTNTVEGQTWWLELLATPLFVLFAVRSRRPLARWTAVSFCLAAALIGVWAVWQGGIPQFSDVGWI